MSEKESGPFGGILGTTRQIKILELIIPLNADEDEFTAEQISRATKIPEGFTETILDDFMKHKVLRCRTVPGNAIKPSQVRKYTVNRESSTFWALKNYIFAVQSDKLRFKSLKALGIPLEGITVPTGE